MTDRPIQAPVTFNYSSPGTRRHPLLAYFLPVAYFYIPTIALLAVLVLVVPKFRGLFKDFKTSLPVLTEWMLYFSDIVANHFGWIPFLALPWILALFPFVVDQLAPPANAPRWRRRMVLMLILAFFLLVAVIVVGLLLPLIKLIQSVSGAPGP